MVISPFSAKRGRERTRTRGDKRRARIECSRGEREERTSEECLSSQPAFK
jgi:hypothetical protein